MVEFAHQQLGISGFHPGVVCGLLGAVIVVLIGKVLARRKEATAAPEVIESGATANH